MATKTVKEYEHLFEHSLAEYTRPDSSSAFAGIVDIVNDDESQPKPELLSILRSKPILTNLEANLSRSRWEKISTITKEQALNKLIFRTIDAILINYQEQATHDAIDVIVGSISTYDHEAHVNRMREIIHFPVEFTDSTIVTQSDVDKLKKSLIEGIEHPKQGMGIFENEISYNPKGNYANICRAIIKKTEYIPGWEFGDDFRKKLGLGPAPRSAALAQLKALKGLSLCKPEAAARDKLYEIFNYAINQTDPDRARQYLHEKEAEITSNLGIIKNSKNEPHNVLIKQLWRIVSDIFDYLHAFCSIDNPVKEKKKLKDIFTLFQPSKAGALTDEIKDISDKLAPSNEDVSDKPGPKGR